MSFSRLPHLVLFLFAALASLPTTLRADENADHDALRKLRAIYEDAVNTNDLSKLKPILGDGFTGVMISGEEIRSFEELQAFWKRAWDLMGAGGSYHVKVITDRTDFFGDIGISRGYTQELFRTASGKEYPVQARWTAITRRENGEWKVFRVQGAVNPMDNALITDMLRRVRLLFGVFGLATGLAFGLFLIRIIRRKNQPRAA